MRGPRDPVETMALILVTALAGLAIASALVAFLSAVRMPGLSEAF